MGSSFKQTLAYYDGKFNTAFERSFHTIKSQISTFLRELSSAAEPVESSKVNNKFGEISTKISLFVQSLEMKKDDYTRLLQNGSFYRDNKVVLIAECVAGWTKMINSFSSDCILYMRDEALKELDALVARKVNPIKMGVFKEEVITGIRLIQLRLPQENEKINEVLQQVGKFYQDSIPSRKATLFSCEKRRGVRLSQENMGAELKALRGYSQ